MLTYTAVTKKKMVCGSRSASQNCGHFHWLSVETVWFSLTLSMAIFFSRSFSHRAFDWLSGIRYARISANARLNEPKNRKNIFHVATLL